MIKGETTMQIKPIVWKFTMLGSFSCYACNKNRAEFRAKLQHKGIKFNLCLCKICVNLPEIEVIETIFGKATAQAGKD
jgi:hypothetical protein